MFKCLFFDATRKWTRLQTNGILLQKNDVETVISLVHGAFSSANTAWFMYKHKILKTSCKTWH
jgi:hypothetical protein